MTRGVDSGVASERAGEPVSESGPFRWSREHDEFRAVLRDLVTARASLAGAPSPKSPDPAERALWRNWPDELGLPGLAVPEQYGGAGFSRLELAIAANELGRAVVGGPLLASAVLATEALLAGGGPVAEEVLPTLATGARIATLAVVESTQRWRPDDVATTASGGAVPRLRGVKDAVLTAEDADLLVVAAREDAGVSLFVVEVDDGVAIAPLQVLDSSRPMARVTLTDVAARRVGAPGEGWPMVEHALELVLNCDLVICSERARFADTHARVGVLPGWGLTVLLPLAVGRFRARQMSLTGDLLTAAQAHEAGLVTEVLPHAELLPRATEIASSIANNNARAVRALLASYRDVEAEVVAGGYAVESRTARAWGESDLDLAESGRRRAALMERARRQTSEDS